MQYGMFYMCRCEKPHVKRILTDDNNFEITVSSILTGFSSGHGVFTSCIPGVLWHPVWEAMLHANSSLYPLYELPKFRLPYPRPIFR